MACSSIWIIHQSRRFVCLLNLSLLHLRRSLAISAGTKIDKLQTVLGTIQHEYHDNLCVHAHCMHCFNKRHIVCILFLPLFGTGACKCLEPSRVISIISNCIVSSIVSCPTSPCLNVLACSSSISSLSQFSYSFFISSCYSHLSVRNSVIQSVHAPGLYSSRQHRIWELPISCNCR